MVCFLKFTFRALPPREPKERKETKRAKETPPTDPHHPPFSGHFEPAFFSNSPALIDLPPYFVRCRDYFRRTRRRNAVFASPFDRLRASLGLARFKNPLGSAGSHFNLFFRRLSGENTLAFIATFGGHKNCGLRSQFRSPKSTLVSLRLILFSPSRRQARS